MYEFLHDTFQGLAELDLIIKDLIDIGVEMKSHEDSIDDIYQKLGQGDSIVRLTRSNGCHHFLTFRWSIEVNAIDRYDKGVKSRMEDYAKKTTRQKYAKSEVYAKFKYGIFVRVYSVCVTVHSFACM